MNRRDFLLTGVGLAAAASIPTPALALPTPAPVSPPTELAALLDAMVWDRPQLIFISGRYAYFEKVYLANEIGKRLQHPFIIHEWNWVCEPKKSTLLAMQWAKECFTEKHTIIGLPFHLTVGMRYMASVIFEVGYGTKDNGVYAGLAKNRWTPLPLTGTVVKLGTCETTIVKAPPKADFLIF